MMLQAMDDHPLNVGFSGKGNTADTAGLGEVLRAGTASAPGMCAPRCSGRWLSNQRNRRAHLAVLVALVPP